MANQAATSSTPAFPSFQLSSTDSTVIVDNNSGSGSAATLRSTRGASVIAVKGLKFFNFLSNLFYSIHFILLKLTLIVFEIYYNFLLLAIPLKLLLSYFIELIPIDLRL